MNYTREQMILWRLPSWANDRFEELIDELQRYSTESEEYDSIVEEIKGLPGFPVGTPPHVTIHRVVTTARSR